MFTLFSVITSELYLYWKRYDMVEEGRLALKNVPRIVVLEGNIGAGKTTFLTALKTMVDTPIIMEPVQQMLYPINLLELAHTHPFISQMHILNIMKRQMQNILKKHGKEVILMERGIYSCDVFIKVSYKLGKITLDERNILMKELHKAKRELEIPPFPTKFIYLDTPVGTCLSNIRKRNRKGEEKLNLRYLQMVAQEQKNHLRKHDDVMFLN